MRQGTCRWHRGGRRRGATITSITPILESGLVNMAPLIIALDLASAHALDQHLARWAGDAGTE